MLKFSRSSPPVCAMLWCTLLIGLAAWSLATGLEQSECLVCERVIKAAKELAIKQNIPASSALEKYCSVPSAEVEDAQFCYNVDTLKKDVNRLLLLGADASRICKKVKAINPDFCKTKVAKVERTGIQLNDRFKKGIIYE